MYWFVFCLVIVAVISLGLNVGLLFRFVWTKNSRARSMAQNISLSLFSFLVIAILLELYFRLFFAQSDAFGYTLAEKNWQERYWRVNSLGYRDIEWTPELLAGRTRVMVLGDSFVAGAGIEDPADRFPDLLGQMLGPGYAVMNVGVSGAGTKEEIERALDYPYRPDILILSFYLNDIDETAEDMGFERPEIKTESPFLVEDSYALNFLYWRVYRLGPKEWSDAYWNWLLRLYDNPEVWQVYQNELLQIENFMERTNDRLIVVVFPELRAVEQSRPITSRAADLFRQRGVPVLDVTGLVAGLDSADLVVNPVDSHPSELVHRLVAENLYPLVLDSRQASGDSIRLEVSGR